MSRAAEISKQTLYNYFATKEHLVFDLDREYESRIVGVVLHRKQETSLVTALRAAALKFLNEASRAIGKKQGLLTTRFAVSPPLRRVWIDLNCRIAESVAGCTHAR